MLTRTAPAPPTRAVCSQGRGAASQEEVEGRAARDQGTNKAAKEGPREREDQAEGQEEDDEEESPDDDEDDNSSSSGEQESNNESPAKPPMRSQHAKEEDKTYQRSG